MSTEETQVIESEILSEEQIKEVVEETPTETPDETLPSEVPEFEMPEKFQGKTAEEIAQSYLELEKMKGGDSTSTEETPTEETPQKETPKEVDPEYEEWKKEKQLKDVLDPIGGMDTYKQALEWAKENMTAEELKVYDDTLRATNDVNTIRLITKGLIAQASSNPTPQEPQVVHSAETTKMPKTTGYETKSEMLKDMSDPRYDRDASYRAKVEAKLAKTDESKWYAGLPRS